jgi:hypothetical protein
LSLDGGTYILLLALAVESGVEGRFAEFAISLQAWNVA